MPVRGIRGATTISQDTETEVLEATVEILEEIRVANPSLQPEDIASAFFTVTSDIRSAFPARAAEKNGWRNVPRICAQEIPVEGSTPYCIRVLLLWNTDLRQDEIRHIYIKGARNLRPDLIESQT
ncbi:MAG: chorismate mutase [Anaerolineales bacterium]|uniref:chorismate mutase n=1 Tax=Candidatus Desulfolinea nitratireducens TaxID=2841698 RepID=A0A8J6NJH5_9CHLR|nr:chorismate mutase [Candidatus Desulfolinea nitratireducens]